MAKRYALPGGAVGCPRGAVPVQQHTNLLPLWLRGDGGTLQNGEGENP